MPPKDRSFLTRVRQALPSLHPAERRLGDFVCDFPGELASYSAQELAALAHVSKATVSRFVQRLGYENYEEARRHARAHPHPPGAARQAPATLRSRKSRISGNASSALSSSTKCPVSSKWNSRSCRSRL